MMALLLHSDSDNVTPTGNRQSSKEEEIDLEDGEIEDDEEEVPKVTEVVQPVPPKIEPPIIKAPVTELSPIESVDKTKKKTKKPVVSKLGVNDGVKGGEEDDWADNVEKAIRAAMGGEIKEPEENGDVGEDGEDRKKKKKRKKRHRGDEDGDERKESKRRKKHHRSADEEEGDDDEMLFVRGASPIMREHDGEIVTQYQDDPYHYADDLRQFDDYSSYDDDSDDDFMEGGGNVRAGRGRGRGRGIRGGVRGGVARKMGRGRGDTLKKRRQQRDQRQGPESVCMFFMQGKCQKGDECPYSHDASPPRKMELCKFYLMDCCAKKDKCLYMHHDFPCKYHHTGLKCFAGDRCKFNHGVLTEVLKSILLRHLETAPKEILGDFPRLTREGAAQMVQDKKARETAAVATPTGKSIPSLFDIEVAMPTSMMEGSPRRDTPMPSEEEEVEPEGQGAPNESRPVSKRHKNRWDGGGGGGEDLVANVGLTDGKLSLRQVHEEKKMRWDEEIRKQLEETHKAEQGEKKMEEEGGVDAKKKRRAEKEREKTRRREEKKQRREEREGRKWEMEERERTAKVSVDKSEVMLDSFARQDFNQQLDQMRQRQETAESTQKSRLLKLAGYAGLESPERPGFQREQDNVMDVDDRDIADRKQSVDETALVIDTHEEEEEHIKEEEKVEGVNEIAGEIPTHLPRKQQELFLRIQQQQALREENLKASKAETESAAEKDDEDWYSSDEETGRASLSTVLKNLSTTPNNDDNDLKKKAEDLTKIADVSEAVNKLLSSIGMLTEPTATTASPPQTMVPLGRLELPMPPAPLARDPRSVAVSATRDPRKRPSTETQRSPSLYDTAKPRSDPRSRVGRRTSSSGPSGSVAATLPSIYSSIVLPETRAEDVDLRPKDIDLRPSLKDLDLRTPQAFGDLDLRIRPDGVVPADLRQMLGGLPFKPVPAHEAATEIDAGVHSHPPMAYRVAVICIPPPDYSKLRLSTAEPMVRTDPRLRRLFNLSTQSPTSPPQSPPAPSAPRADPRRLANQARDEQEPEANPGFVRSAFPSPLGPGQFAPLGPGTGLLGPGPGMPGPGMVPGFQGPSRFDEGPDTDLRHFYGNKMQPDWNEQAQWEQAQQMRMQQEMHMHQMQQQMSQHHPHRGGNRGWRENRNNGRRNNRNDRGGGHRNRSYTPPM